jgi:site-specific DNA-methyltransferase (cytosine-N4-specific)
MSAATWMQGDVFEQMAKLEDGSIDAVITSPPFLALRSYLPAGHPDKGKEIGSETTPAAYISVLLALTREWRRLLAPHGSIAVELGDTYSGANVGGERDDGGQYGYHGTRGGTKYNLDTRPARGSSGWPLDKSLCLLPTLYPASLAYGWNMLDPDDRIDPWRIRNVVVWHRPNPPVGALGDKCRPSTSYVTIACMRRDRWFDLDAERGPGSPNTHARVANGVVSRPTSGKRADNPNNNFGSMAEMDTAGAPPLDYWQLEDEPQHQAWTIPTQPYAGSHYATFPIALPRRLIRLMCPQHVCRVCEVPRRRIVEKTEEYAAARTVVGDFRSDRPGAGLNGTTQYVDGKHMSHADTITVGWSDCGHDNYRRGRVLDPFAGSGTTLAAATEQGRDAVGIDIDADNYWLARQRIGLFLEEPA